MTRSEKLPLSAPIFINAIATAAPSNSKTIDTVVEVGISYRIKKI